MKNHRIGKMSRKFNKKGGHAKFDIKSGPFKFDKGQGPI
jgi:hypothetical protein